MDRFQKCKFSDVAALKHILTDPAPDIFSITSLLHQFQFNILLIVCNQVERVE